jgi:hypothetical protein
MGKVTVGKGSLLSGPGDNQVEAEKQVKVKVEVEKNNRTTPLSWTLPGLS